MSHITKPVLCYVTERRSLALPPGANADDALVEQAAKAAQAGVDWVQIREKDLPGGALLRLTAAIRERAARSRVLVNDRLDVALAAKAGGVHLGEAGLPVAAVRQWCSGRTPPNYLVGRSCHSLAEAQAAERDGADYVFFGPVFATPAKQDLGEPQGVVRLAEVCKAMRIPVIAIGGIRPSNAAACLMAGAAGLAAIRCFQENEYQAALVAEFREVVLRLP